MPLVDGIHSARMIRAYEKSDDGMRRTKQRVPIIAVSASLTEENRFDYVDAGYFLLHLYRQIISDLVQIRWLDP
jgi:CheY-like chemotaxis protein